jgi:hypothetical protein
MGGWQQLEPAASRISALVAWRRGCAVVVSLSGAALVAGLGTVGPLAGVAIGLGIVVAIQASLHRFVDRCALRPELACIPAVARRRRRICCARRRRDFASSLRSLASASPRERKNPYVLWGRVSLVADELCALADELECADDVDPRTIRELDRLLCDGRDSPMLNPQLPVSELASTLLRIRFRLITDSCQTDTGTPTLKMGGNTNGSRLYT